VDLLLCQRPGQRQRLAVFERVAQRKHAEEEQLQQLQPQPAPPPAWPLRDDTSDAAAARAGLNEAAQADRGAVRCVWHRLREADLPHEQYTVAYRLLHGCLYVGALLDANGGLEQRSEAVTGWHRPAPDLLRVAHS
jgi:hypothetical protein